jgi:hypothetical protein
MPNRPTLAPVASSVDGRYPLPLGRVRDTGEPVANSDVRLLIQ